MIFNGPVGFYQSGGGDVIVNPALAIDILEATVSSPGVSATVSSPDVVCTVQPLGFVSEVT